MESYFHSYWKVQDPQTTELKVKKTKFQSTFSSHIMVCWWCGRSTSWKPTDHSALWWPQVTFKTERVVTLQPLTASEVTSGSPAHSGAAEEATLTLLKITEFLFTSGSESQHFKLEIPLTFVRWAPRPESWRAAGSRKRRRRRTRTMRPWRPAAGGSGRGRECCRSLRRSASCRIRWRGRSPNGCSRLQTCEGTVTWKSQRSCVWSEQEETGVKKIQFVW